MKLNKSFKRNKTGVLSLCVAAAAAGVPYVSAQGDTQIAEEVIVTGYRGSLLNSTMAKRNSVGFSDEIFADDIGKMPSQNLAESLARIPGVRIGREVDGEGQQIAVRGLGPSFTKVVLNGNSMLVSSSGSLDAGNRDRQVDLDMFPPELFRSLSVDKTAKASHLEGGVSGYVNMRTLRPSDMGEGHNFNFAVEGGYKETADAINPKIAATYSFSDDRFGALVSIVSKNTESRVDGYEHDSPFVSGCVADPTINNCIEGSTGWNNFHYTDVASPDYAAAHAGVNAGDIVDIEDVSGLTLTQLDNFTMPRIARMMTKSGTKDNLSALVALEFNPNDDMRFALDVIRAEADTEFERTEAMLIYRNNLISYDLAALPENIVLETVSDEAGSEERIVSGTFYSVRPFIGTRSYEEDLSFTSIMPSMSWQINDDLRMDLSLSRTKSDFTRDEPYVLYYGPEGTLDFSYDSGSIVPQMDFSADLSSANADWVLRGSPAQGIDLRFARGDRETETKGLHLNFAYGEDPDANGLKFGLSSEELSSDSNGYSGVGYGDHILQNAPNIIAEWQDYMIDAPYNDIGTDIDGYRGITGIATVDWGKFKNDINYDGFVPSPARTDQFAGIVGSITEKVTAIYAEANTETEVGGRTLRTNSGIRLVDTDQDVSTINGSASTDYSRILPSFSVVYDVVEDIKLRASASRSLTRAEPSKLFPDTAWNGNTIEGVTAGNPRLAPFEATNFDIGGEWYFSELGYIGINYFEKDLVGFTRNDTVAVQFADLADEWSVNIDDLSAEQEDALAECGGVNSPNCIVQATRPVNIDGLVNLSGVEVIWVQPLDFLVEGLGFNASANNINQKASEGTEIGGISDSRNFTLYYENNSFQTRVTYYEQDGSDTGTSLWGYDRNRLYNRDRSQLDLSMSYNLPFMEEYGLVLTFDAYNLTNEPISTYVEDASRTYRAYFPGATYTLGIRGSF